MHVRVESVFKIILLLIDFSLVEPNKWNILLLFLNDKKQYFIENSVKCSLHSIEINIWKHFFAKDLSKMIYWRYKDKIFTSLSESLRISKFCTRYEFKFRTNIGMLMMLFNVADNYTEEFNKLFLFFL